MNQHINEDLILKLSSNTRLTKLALLCMAYRLLLLLELKEFSLTEEQGLEFEELKEFFYGNGVRIKEDDYGAIFFEYRDNTPVISMEDGLGWDGYSEDADEDGEDGPVK